MKNYTLSRYIWDDEEVVLESNNIDKIVNYALSESSNNECYTYRIDAYEDGEWIGRWRFFNNGREFTQDIVNSISPD